MGKILENAYNRYRGGVHLSLIIASPEKPFFPQGEMVVNKELDCSYVVIDHVVEGGAMALRLSTDVFDESPPSEVGPGVKADVELYNFLGRVWENNRDLLVEVADAYQALANSPEAQAMPSDKRVALLADTRIAAFYVNKRGEFLDSIAVRMRHFDWRHNQPIAHFLSAKTPYSAIRGQLFGSAMGLLG